MLGFGQLHSVRRGYWAAQIDRLIDRLIDRMDSLSSSTDSPPIKPRGRGALYFETKEFPQWSFQNRTGCFPFAGKTIVRLDHTNQSIESFEFLRQSNEK